MALAAAGGCLLTVLALMPQIAAAENIKIGVTKTAAGGTLYLAQERGYFADEGIAADIMFLDPPAIYAGVVSGALDFGQTGASAAFYNLASKGALKIIAANASDIAGFPLYAIIASNNAYLGGLTSFRQLGGRRVAINEVGSILQYIIGRLAETQGFNFSSIQFLPLQSIPNILSAVTGNQAEAGIATATSTAAAIQHGDMKLLGFPGAEVPLQAGISFTAGRTASERRNLVERYLRALAKGRRDYVEAFIGPDGNPKQGATTGGSLAIIAQYVGQPVDLVKHSISYVDPDGRLNVRDVLRQIAWYKDHGFVKPEVDGNAIIDMRYVVPLPDK